MKVYVMVDIEGISGIYTKAQVLPSEPRFDEGRRYMTADVNACVKGLKAGGADTVYVCDCHGGHYTLRWEDVSSEADYCLCGDTAGRRYYGIEDCDAVVLLGYHAMAGTKGAVLEHTFSSVQIQSMEMNGQPIGEIAFDAAVAGEYGKPVIMVSGDDKACAEAKAILPDTVTACVKKGIDIYGAMLIPPESAHTLIFNKAKEAIANFKNCKPFTFKKPMECRVEVTERTHVKNSVNAPYMQILDSRSFLVTGDTAEEILFRACMTNI